MVTASQSLVVVPAAWRHEATLPWANASLTRSIAEHELDALEYFVPFMPMKMRADVIRLASAWTEFRDALISL